ncbi:hypothetical protein EDB83DRAFT_2314660 [Lactarius deliciosus]|nr:hypothetical protein EDB83DRAFT_2314660 [Lactarius deliciosus]
MQVDHVPCVINLKAILLSCCSLHGAASSARPASDHAMKNAPSWAPQVASSPSSLALPASLSFLPSCCSRHCVTVLVGVIVVGVACHVGVALWRLLHTVRGGGDGRLVRGDGLEAAATGLCAARWRWRQRWGLSPAAGGVGAKRQGVVVWWIACPQWYCPRGGL